MEISQEKKYGNLTEDKINEIIKDIKSMGSKPCSQKYNLSINQINGIKSKFNVYIPKDSLRKIRSASKIKSPETHKVNHYQFLNVEDSYIAYLLGLLWSDGHVAKGSNMISFTTTAPDDQHFLKFFLQSGEWGVNKRKTPSGWKQSYSFYTANKFLKELLSNKGFMKKQDGFNSIFNHLPNEFWRFFVLGLSDGDGCFYFNDRCGNYKFSIASSLNQNWQDLTYILDNLKVKFNIERSSTDKGSYSKVIISGKKNVKSFGDWIYRDGIGFGLKRKYEKFLLISEQCKVKTGPKPQPHS